MLLKVFKHSVKDTIKVAGIIAGVIPVAFAIVGLVMRLLFAFGDMESVSVSGVTALTLSSILSITIMIVCFAPIAFTLYLLIATHRDFTTDRAYLTFTLPIKARDLILGKSLSIILQFAILALAEIIGLFIFALFVISGMGVTLGEVVQGITQTIQGLGQIVVALTGSGWDVVYFIELIISSLQSVVLSVFIVVLVAVLAGNNKKRLAIILGVWFIGGYVVSAILTVALVEIINFIIAVEEVTTFTYQIFQILGMVITGLITFIVYKIAKRKIEDGINLV